MLSPTRTQLGDWLNELFLIEQDVRLKLEPLGEAQFNWRPAAGKWSIAECLDHLALTTSLMLTRVRPALDRAAAEGRMGNEPYRYGAIGGKFVRWMEAPGKRSMPTPANFVPASGLPKSAVLGKFAGSMEEFREALKASHGLALDRIKAPSSAKGGWWLRLNLAAWFAASLAHGRRHVAQAVRVMQAEGFPKPS